MWVSSSSWHWQPLSFSHKVGHTLLLPVVMVTASQQQQKVDLCIRLLPMVVLNMFCGYGAPLSLHFAFPGT